MTSPFSTDDLRTELRLQAREAEAWDLPPVALPRRVPRRRGWAVLAVSAALVAAVLVVPGWLGGSVRPVGPTGGADPSSAAPAVDAPVVVDYDDLGSRCSDETAAADDGGACWVPVTVMSDGRLLEGRGQEARGAAGASFASVTLDPQDGEQAWVMVAGRGGGHPDVEVGVAGRSTTWVEASDSPTLVRLPPTGGGPTTVSARWSGGAKLVLRTFQPVAASPRADWETTLQTLTACEDVEDGCAAPSSVVVDGIDLVRGEDGAQGAGDLRGRFDRPLPGAWFMLGTSEPDGGGPLEVSVGGGAPVTVPVDRPVLVRVPDGATASYRVRTDDGRRLPLFMWVYRLAEG